MKFQILLAVSLGCMALTNGYPSGPPVQTCGEMFPNHQVDAMSTSPPYNVTVYPSTYSPGQNVTVTITALVEHFEGFFLQARKADCTGMTEPRGVFFVNIPEATAMMCSGNSMMNAVAHTTNSHRQSITVLWTNFVEEDVFFRATIVRHFDRFWTNVQSPTLFHTGSKRIGIPYRHCAARSRVNENLVTAGVSPLAVSLGVVQGLVTAALAIARM